MNELKDKPKFITRYEELIKSYLYHTVSAYNGNTSIYINNYFGWTDENDNQVSLGYQGKGFRPSICLLICDSLEGDINAACPSAISIELVHNFSLIHDDIEDNDKYRRHQPTLWAIWGIPKALLAGNSILVLGNQELNKLINYGITRQNLFKSQKILTESYLKMMEGQFLDIAFESQEKISKEEYINMIGLKTGALIECAVMLGAVASKKTLSKQDLFQISKFGRNIGLLFQIRDDILGVWGSDKTGKPIGADIKKKKKSLPIILTLNQERGVYKDIINKIMHKPELNDKDIERFIEIMNVLNIKKECENISMEYAHKIQKILQNIPVEQNFKSDFNDIAQFLVSRET